MTADELLHKYFDVLAVEQLQPETCVLLNDFRVQILNGAKDEINAVMRAIKKSDNSELEKLTLLWTQLFFEARQTDCIPKFEERDRTPIFAESIIHELLPLLYRHWTIYKKPSEAMILAILEAPKPVFYANIRIFHDFLAMIESIKTYQNFSEPVFRQLKQFYERYQDVNARIPFWNKQRFAYLELKLHALVVQYELIQKYFGNNAEGRTLQPTTYTLLNSFAQEMISNYNNRIYPPLSTSQPVEGLLTLDDAEFQALTVYWTQFFIEAALTRAKAHIFLGKTIIDDLLIALYRNKRTAKESIIVGVLAVFNPKPLFYDETSVAKYFVALLEKFHKKNAFSATTLAAITDFYTQYKALKVEGGSDEKEHQQLQTRLSALITAPNAAPAALPFDNKIGQRFSFYELRPNELNSAGWPALIAADIATMPLAQQQAWNILWAHAAKADGGSPKKTWLTHAKTLVKTVEDFNDKATQWLELVLEDVKDNDVELSNAFSEANKVAIKGFIWLCSLTGSEVFASVLSGLVNFGYSKAYGVGARAPAVANAALYTLGLLGAQGVVQLSKLRSKVKFQAGLKLIEKSLAEAAARQGISQDDLEELSVPLFGLNAYSKQATFGQYHVIAHLQGSKNIQEQWSNSRDGSVLKKMPASVKKDYRSEFKDWQKEITDIQDVLTGQIKRLEDSYLRKRQWRFSDWQARFIQHPLLSWLGKRLIWRFEHQGQIQHGLFLSDSLVNSQQQPLTAIADDAVVTLWHPILSTVEEVQQWRTLLTAQQIVQPIKQAYREVYFITPAEIETGDYSNRFARHILKQHHFAALCKERGWGYRLQGNFDGHNHPCQGVPAWQIGVRLELDIPEGSLTTAAGLYQYITTAAVRFSHAGQSCALVDVPPIVFSEMMRDIDLFVGVTSIGTDAATDMYADNNHADYIDAFSKAELSARAIVRKDVLSNIISKLAIAPRCSFDNKHLIVKGDLRTYKIHLGSSNILMEPNDQYLCIVPSSKQKEASTEGLYLPFEGDHMLSVILSKALLLAADKKIKDEGIVSQIKRV